MKKNITLSKSRIVEGLSCDKKVYLSIHNPELKAPVSPAKQQVFDQGHEIGLLAHNKYPNGTLIDVDYRDTSKAVEQTQQAIKNGVNTIYEATFRSDSLLCKVDILHRYGLNEPWQIIEVKSGSSAKPEYMIDAAIQAHILNLTNVEWEKVSIMHLNKECRFPNLSNLLIETDITEQVHDLIEDLPDQIGEIMKIATAPNTPETSIGRYCEKPYECDFKNHCWKHVPEYSVFDLPLSWKLYDKGYLSLESIKEADLTNSQKVPYKVAISGKREINLSKLQEALQSWSLPFYHLDFETIGPAIPRYDGTTPFANVPFQFSLHIQNDYSSIKKHLEYLHQDVSDPRRKLSEKLVEFIPKDGGTVVAFNASFEARVLKELGNLFPDLNDHLVSIADRLQDPQKLIKKYVYDKEFRGSFSLKDVAPALLGEKWNYKNLDVYDGKAAQRAFDEMISSGTSPQLKEDLKQQLIAYCTQDTIVMAELIKWIMSQ